MQKHEEWFFFASQDVAYARLAIVTECGLILPAIYHTQQAAEKALKAYLCFSGDIIPRTHDLLRLLMLCSKFDRRMELLYEHCQELNPYATKLRYPNDLWFIPELAELQAAVNRAEYVCGFLEDAISFKKK